MALKGSILIKNVLQIDNAYVKIDNYLGDKTYINATLGIYKDKDTTGNKLDEINISFIPDVSDTAPIIFKQIYRKIKENTQYSSLMDVLEEGQTA